MYFGKTSKKVCKMCTFLPSIQMMDQTLIIKVLTPNTNIAEDATTIKECAFRRTRSTCEYNLYADDTSFYSVFHDFDASANNPNHDQEKINE